MIKALRSYRRAGQPNYEVAIPSYNRPQELIEGTLAVLCRHHVPLERIKVYVASGVGPKQIVTELQRYIGITRGFFG